MSPTDPDDLPRRLERLGRRLGEREASHRPALEEARIRAEKLRSDVETALDRFHRAAAGAGAPSLRAELSEVRVDDKHLRAVQFDLRRGRHRALVTVKGRGEITFVGPFRQGKAEGPCHSLPVDAADEIREALAVFLERFLEEAATP